MQDFEIPEMDAPAEAADEHPPVLDGTANVEFIGDEAVPRVKGLVELISQYLGDRPR